MQNPNPHVYSLQPKSVQFSQQFAIQNIVFFRILMTSVYDKREKANKNERKNFSFSFGIIIYVWKASQNGLYR
jgi:hypothetical protein